MPRFFHDGPLKFSGVGHRGPHFLSKCTKGKRKLNENKNANKCRNKENRKLSIMNAYSTVGASLFWFKSEATKTRNKRAMQKLLQLLDSKALVTEERQFEN